MLLLQRSLDVKQRSRWLHLDAPPCPLDSDGSKPAMRLLSRGKIDSMSDNAATTTGCHLQQGIERLSGQVLGGTNLHRCQRKHIHHSPDTLNLTLKKPNPKSWAPGCRGQRAPLVPLLERVDEPPTSNPKLP